MKKNILFILLITAICFESRAQDETKNFIFGSYINTKIIDYYNSNDFHACEDNFFDNKGFEPLYITINKDSSVEMSLRFEQKTSFYHIHASEMNSYTLVNAYISRKLVVNDGNMILDYNGNTIGFAKVSDESKKDVFGEFIEYLLFVKNKNLSIDTSLVAVSSRNLVLNRTNFLTVLKELFKCEYISFAELATFKYDEKCLPSIALYYNETSGIVSPRVFGIHIAVDSVKLIDEKGNVILKLLYNN